MCPQQDDRRERSPLRRLLLSFDAASFAGAAREGPGDADDGTLATRIARCFARALLGDSSEVAAHALYAAASGSRDAAAACDAATVRALAALGSGDEARATELARHASRMARTEALPDQEALANIVLARVRRTNGRPYLATRILGAVVRMADPDFRGWIAWELALAGGREAAGDLAEVAPARSFLAMLDAARAGDRARLAGLREELSTRLRGLPGFERDLLLAYAMLDPEVSLELEPAALAAFRRGLVDEAPFGVLGLAALAESAFARDESGEGAASADSVFEAEGAPVSILVEPHGRATRFLTLSAALAPNAARLPPSQRKQGRTDIALAVLALAGREGLAEEELFRRAYGFAFSRNVHRGVLDVLLHRARKHLGDLGELARDDGHLTLRPAQQLLLVDPRCSPREDDRVLRLVARRGKMTAKDAADELNIPLRSVQAALESLLSAGACTRERAGRAVEYRVDDTTFQEPTDLGRSPT